ncbi:hypothetical protein [Photobacterium chitinilyticum]|uniref:Uncharacterized protein n=1 Tax=Photobacterium chitinilyticum TaxID=2485123 RepID=A0A3S3RI67_9GAMM|nr:hypothetical protein [Photobacterium chitinilyticum]RWX55979.1 hypothetical protein EDI28_06690 [Photobacterium chitinilyticum]
MLDFANSQALKSKQTKATTASNIIKNVILSDLNELYSPAEIEVLQQAQQLIEDGKSRIRYLKEKRRREEKQRLAAEAKLHERAFEVALAALDDMTLAELYQLNVSFTFQSSAVNELIEDYDHQHYLATVQSWLDADVSTDSYVDLSPEEAKEGWKVGIAKAAVEIISWPCLKYHRDYQEPSANYIEPLGIPDDFPVAIYTDVRHTNWHRLTIACLKVVQAITDYEENEKKVRFILSSLGQDT